MLIHLDAGRVEDEATDFILASDEELPPVEDGNLTAFWTELMTQKLPNDTFVYKSLATLAICLSSIAHSNADAERSFSILRKIQTDWRGRLAHETIHSLMSCKFNISGTCYEYKPPQNVLANAKKACNM